MCATNLISLSFIYIVLIVAIATQFKDDVHSENGTNVIEIFEAIKELSKDKYVIILTQNDSRDANATAKPFVNEREIDKIDTDYEDSENFDEQDENFEEQDENFEEQDKIQQPKMKNILRWVPKTYRLKKHGSAEREAALAKNRTTMRARARNAKRIEYVNRVMKDNYWTTLYLYGEIRRILTERVVYDDIRTMISVLEKEGYEKIKQNVIDCYKKAKARFTDKFWHNKKTNNLLIRVHKDPVNDDVKA